MSQCPIVLSPGLAKHVYVSEKVKLPRINPKSGWQWLPEHAHEGIPLFLRNNLLPLQGIHIFTFSKNLTEATSAVYK